jgi:GMP synthase-like glutamine amidotransferase
MKKSRIHCLQHVSFEGIGCIADWAEECGHTLTHTKFYANDTLPAFDDFDCLIIMGGPMSVHDDEVYNWLTTEKAFIKSAIDAGKKVMGICLGAQLIATALDADVYPNAEKEIGWLPIQFSKDALAAFPFLHATETVFHWHGDTFDLPNNAIRLAESEACKNQAYMIHQQVLGLQFHLEITKELLQQMLHHGADELVETNYVQSAIVISERKYLRATNNKILFQIFDTFLAL